MNLVKPLKVILEKAVTISMKATITYTFIAEYSSLFFVKQYMKTFLQLTWVSIVVDEKLHCTLYIERESSKKKLYYTFSLFRTKIFKL